MTEVEYILGHSESEIRRLMLQAAMLRPLTERLLLDAGLAPGMRVLDVGCGVGDVAMLAASIVGPSGKVVGVDREAVAIKAAQQRADAAGLAIQYHQAAIEDRPDLGEFDFAVGRYVLSHQPDPTSFVRTVSSYVRQGGVVAFHEALVTRDLLQLNRAPLWQRVVEVTISAFGAAMQHPDVGARLVETFHAAGLDGATVWCDVMTYCQPDNPVFTWFSLVLRSSLPHIERLGLATAAELDVDTLEDRLQVEAASLHSQVVFPSQFSGWARKRL
jgi:SAM-dependent methyltransferase